MSKITVKITQQMLLDAASKVAGDNKVLARVLVAMYGMRLEPAVNSESAWIHKPSGSVKEGDQMGLEVKAKLKGLNFNAELVDVLTSMKEARGLWLTFISNISESQHEALNEFTVWLEKFY